MKSCPIKIWVSVPRVGPPLGFHLAWGARTWQTKKRFRTHIFSPAWFLWYPSKKGYQGNPSGVPFRTKAKAVNQVTKAFPNVTLNLCQGLGSWYVFHLFWQSMYRSSQSRDNFFRTVSFLPSYLDYYLNFKRLIVRSNRLSTCSITCGDFSRLP